MGGLRPRRRHGVGGGSTLRWASRSSGRGPGSGPSRRRRPAPSSSTSRRCSRSGSAPTATGATTRRTSWSASSHPSIASWSRGSWPSTRTRSTSRSRAPSLPSSTGASERHRCARIRGSTLTPDLSRRRCRAHEQPYAHQAGGGEITSGMVLAIEPGCYIDGGGGLRVEDNFLITEVGPVKLSPFPDGVVSA